jgi:hypothetical protein
MPLSFVFIQLLALQAELALPAEQEESIGNRNGTDQNWVESRRTMADILLVPGIGPKEARLLAVNDETWCRGECPSTGVHVFVVPQSGRSGR